MQRKRCDDGVSAPSVGNRQFPTNRDHGIDDSDEDLVEDDFSDSSTDEETLATFNRCREDGDEESRRNVQ